MAAAVRVAQAAAAVAVVQVAAAPVQVAAQGKVAPAKLEAAVRVLAALAVAQRKTAGMPVRALCKRAAAPKEVPPAQTAEHRADRLALAQTMLAPGPPRTGLPGITALLRIRTVLAVRE